MDLEPSLSGAESTGLWVALALIIRESMSSEMGCSALYLDFKRDCGR